ncbi:uncharacterized protein BDZ99DRAFT_519417 [Mytilinidion resinicola]|uniref:BTB domain-containing protein n=1 Tax=Mytilinidion resinicola TaxID=574789 RepID=A0A6A6YQD0_9PEZI|nr:uncharacterized protein BDZ99DRAFT_519417 [Mytilinidion resinicola]KAF2810733.1 hypothetical protein BDZ99DRAFT_519417 [Mytilinidion resinicola]
MDKAQKKLQDQLVTSLDTLFKSGDYSDFKIICGSETHRVHKAIVFPQCEYFAASCRFGGKEAESGEITLQDEQPEHVRAMVYYFYHLIYVVPGPAPSASSINTRGFFEAFPSPFQNDIAPAQFQGDEAPQRSYDDEPLEPTPPPPLLAEEFGDWGAWTTTKQKKENGGKISKRPSEANLGLVFHAHMYALADKYNIEGLKLIAKVRFTGDVQEGWSHEEFPDAIRIVYDTTPEMDLGLRDAIVDVLLKNSSLLDKKEIEAVVKKIAELSYELLKRYHQDYSCHLVEKITDPEPQEPREPGRWPEVW